VGTVEARAYVAQLDAIRDWLAGRDAPSAARPFLAACDDAARAAQTIAERAARAEPDELTRRLGRAQLVRVDPARVVAGATIAAIRLGGPAPVPASGRPFAGQVLFGSEWGGRRRAYRQATGRGARKRGRLAGQTVVKRRSRRSGGIVTLSVAEQRALLHAGGRLGARTTMQFRPYRASGYWLFPALRGHGDELAARIGSAADVIAGEWAAGRG
jgi:hypothetical protein